MDLANYKEAIHLEVDQDVSERHQDARCVLKEDEHKGVNFIVLIGS